MAHSPSQIYEAQTIGVSLFLARIENELELLETVSLDLQGCIHDLDLAASSTEARKTLQSADSLTQSLQCVRTALAGLANARQAVPGVIPLELLDGVFLEDMRDRLVNGRRLAEPGGENATGQVQFF